MKKTQKILFAHSGGSQGKPGQGSYDLITALRKEISDEYEILYPIIDDPEAPTYAAWKRLFDDVFQNVNEPLIIIGHSLGGSIILKYLAEEKPNIVILKLFLVSIPHWGKEDWEVEDFMLPENFEKELEQVSIHLFHCKDDYVVPFEHLNFYKNTLPNASITVLNGSDHAFANGLPELLAEIWKSDIA